MFSDTLKSIFAYGTDLAAILTGVLILFASKLGINLPPDSVHAILVVILGYFTAKTVNATAAHLAAGTPPNAVAALQASAPVQALPAGSTQTTGDLTKTTIGG